MNLAREPRFRLGSLEVRPATREVVHPGGRETLEPRVMSVLVALAQAKGEVVTRDDLTLTCWEGRVVSDDAINRVISRIRRVADLTEGKDFTLETITKVGYRLTVAGQAEAPLEPPPAEPATPPPVLKRTWALMAAGIAAALAIAVAVWWNVLRQPDWRPDPTASLTLAVLPFDNLGANEGDNAIAVAMAREIRNTLSRVRGLRVVSDSSSFAVASEPLTATEIGRRLKADLLLDGSFERSGDTVKVSAELVDGWDGVNVWTGGQSGSAADLESLRQVVVAAVAEQLVQRLGPNRVEVLAPKRRSEPRAYALLVQAGDLIEQIGRARMRGDEAGALAKGAAANDLVDRALAIDPNSAFGLLLKAQITSSRGTAELVALGLDEREIAARSAELMRRALAIDPDEPAALAALGEYYRRFEWRWSDARSLLQRALALDPNFSSGHLWYAYYLSTSGSCLEALEHAQLAIEIDPEFGWRNLGVPRALKCLGRFDESDAAYLNVLDADPSNLFVLREIYLNHLARREPDALDALRVHVRDELWKGAPPLAVQQWLDWTGMAAKALRGDQAEFTAMLERRQKSDPGEGDAVAPPDLQRGAGSRAWIAAIEFAIVGQTERSIDMLQEAIKAGALYVPETMPFGAYEFSAEVRANPRYQAIWRTDPRLAELVSLRREAVEGGQMHGVLPDGTERRPIRRVDTRS